MPNIDLRTIASELHALGITHVVWIPDSELGGLEAYLDPSIRVIRACREGEAIAIAAGLMIGGAQPAVVIQCTGFFEAGDAFRNVVKDLRLPLFLLIGHRNRMAFAEGRSKDSAAEYLPAVLQAWGLKHAVLEPGADSAIVSEMYARSREDGIAAAVVIAE